MRVAHELHELAARRSPVPTNAFDVPMPELHSAAPDSPTYPIALAASRLITADDWTRDIAPAVLRVEDRRKSFERMLVVLSVVIAAILGIAGIVYIALTLTADANARVPNGGITLIVLGAISIVLGQFFAQWQSYVQVPRFASQAVGALSSTYSGRGISFTIHDETVIVVGCRNNKTVRFARRPMQFLRITFPVDIHPPMTWLSHGTALVAAEAAPAGSNATQVHSEWGVISLPLDAVPSPDNGFILASLTDFSSPWSKGPASAEGAVAGDAGSTIAVVPYAAATPLAAPLLPGTATVFAGNGANYDVAAYEGGASNTPNEHMRL